MKVLSIEWDITWALRDEQPTHLPLHPSLHQETTGAKRIKAANFTHQGSKDCLAELSPSQLNTVHWEMHWEMYCTQVTGTIAV